MKILREWYPVEGTKVIDRLSGRTKRAIMARANLLGINKREKVVRGQKRKLKY